MGKTLCRTVLTIQNSRTVWRLRPWRNSCRKFGETFWRKTDPIKDPSVRLFENVFWGNLPQDLHRSGPTIPREFGGPHRTECESCLVWDLKGWKKIPKHLPLGKKWAYLSWYKCHHTSTKVWDVPWEFEVPKPNHPWHFEPSYEANHRLFLVSIRSRSGKSLKGSL